MPAVLRRINRIFRRNSRDQSAQSNNQNNANSNNNNHRNLHRHRAPAQDVNNNNNNNNNNPQQMDQDNANAIYEPSPIKLRSTGYQRQSDGSVTLSVTLDKDQVECCVCLSSMTSSIYRCRGNGSSLSQSANPTDPPRKIVCHNICSSCQWQMQRMKSGNGHTKEMLCPICKVKGIFVRNRALERQLLELSQECTHGKYGCNERFFPWDDTRKMHEKHLCLYQPIDCPFCYQTIHGGRVNFVEHLVKSVQHLSAVADDDDDSIVENMMDESHSMIDEEILTDPEDVDSENDVSFVDNVAVVNQAADDNQEEEEEEKGAINGDVSDDTESEDKADGKKHQVPPCKLAFYESKAGLDLNQNERSIIAPNRNEFIVNYNLGMAICFVAPTEDCPCWKVYAISISSRHGTGGNSRVYLQYHDEEKMNTFMEKEQSLGLITHSLTRPVTYTLILTLGRLHPTSLRKLFVSYAGKNPFVKQNTTAVKKMLLPINNMNEMKDNDEDSNNSNKDNNDMELDEEELDDLEEYRPVEFLGESPCTQLQCGFIYRGNNEYNENSLFSKLSVRLFTLEESLKVGSVIDARDFTGKWYQAEVIAVRDSDGNEFTNLDYDIDDYLEIRRAKIHYLGYSQNYDEWLFVDTDSHRIAQRGTFTVGPDLRAIRRNTTNLANNNARLPHPMHAHRHSRNRRSNNAADDIIDVQSDNNQQ